MARWKTKRRIMRSFKMNEISAVDRPAQAGAIILLSKRDDTDPVETFAKASFQEALDTSRLEQRFNRAFYDAFENIYTINDAFRTALADRYNNSEDTARQYVEAVAELAQRAVEATDGMAKGANVNTEVIKAAIEAAIVEAQEEIVMNLFKNRAELVAAIAKFQKDGGTDEEVRKIAASAIVLDAEDALPATGQLAKRGSDPAVAALQARLDKADKVSALSADARKHYDSLPADQQDAFLALDAAKQGEAVTKAAGDDPVVYTMADGTEITKSMGPQTLLLAKGQDAMAKKLEQVSGALVNADLAKRAATELGNLGGDEATRIAMLKALDGIEDENVRKAAYETLRSANAARKGAFTRVGTNAGGGEADLNKGALDDSLSGPELELDTLAKAAMPEHENDFNKAYAAVLETDKGRELYAQTVAAVQ